MTYNVGGQELVHLMASHSSPGSTGQSQPKYVVFLDRTGRKGTPYDNMLLSFESASFLIMEYVFAIVCGMVIGTWNV